MGIDKVGNKWDLMAEVIQTWIERYPVEWTYFKSAMEERRAQLHDGVYGTNESDSMRLLGSFPPPGRKKNGRPDDLTKYLLKIEPDLMNDRRILKEFFQHFKEFRGAEKI